jgi:hypothetical protein
VTALWAVALLSLVAFLLVTIGRWRWVSVD